MKVKTVWLLIGTALLLTAASFRIAALLGRPPLPSAIDEQRRNAMARNNANDQWQLERVGCPHSAYGCAQSVLLSSGPKRELPSPPQRYHITASLLTPIHTVTPRYPKNALQIGVQGTVVAKLRIGATGVVQSVEPTSGDPVFQRAVTTAFQQWRFRSYLLSGLPVQTETEITVHFKQGAVTVCVKVRKQC